MWSVYELPTTDRFLCVHGTDPCKLVAASESLCECDTGWAWTAVKPVKSQVRSDSSFTYNHLYIFCCFSPMLLDVSKNEFKQKAQPFNFTVTGDQRHGGNDSEMTPVQCGPILQEKDLPANSRVSLGLCFTRLQSGLRAKGMCHSQK